MTQAIPTRLAWIAVDWGSSNLRAWALAGDGEVLAEAEAARGMLGLAPADYEPALLATIGDWLPAEGRVTVLVCGMAGARQGWREASYRSVPTALDALAEGAVRPATEDPRLDVRLLPGLCQGADAGGFDVMRGEETQLAGLAALESGVSGPVCLPGTHAKWATLEDGRVQGFHTYMTGELYRLLAERSVLAHSLGEDDLEDPACREAFTAAVAEAVDAPEAFTQRLFGLRAMDLLDDALPSGEARGAVLAARLSGLAIGLELAGACRDLDAGQTVRLIGGEALCRRYALALSAQGHASEIIANQRAVLAGLGLAHAALDPADND
ncbi:2-dehydro-3-deoxygalactonokinase [Halomonas organivorans]|uniref:2-dehydro-3-deoxygalactonokinase n=1 Tax=Halomonas organivorans TaxID=257772 RepID=A0A7W5G754_9GAMM|nr:2-dehydro-3-deoxygalactonokinase [Halomonas organivorans]MBB3142161.1 2-dehydro-3-deoxygalactonokinase [Halomonas organivorans]